MKERKKERNHTTEEIHKDITKERNNERLKENK